MNILDACRDPQLFAPWFERGDWSRWFAFLAALFGLPMDAGQRRTYRACTGRTKAPNAIAKEGWLIVGRRGGKSFIVALIAAFLAAFHDYAPYLQRGERGTVLIIAADRKQGRVILRYIKAMFAQVPMLAALVERETAEGIDLTNRISIEITTASFRAVRSGTIVAALCDEIAFWRSEDSANPDHEILAAIRPGMTTIPNAMLLALSSPYAKRGELYAAYKRYFGKDGPVLVWQADTLTMNPTVDKRVIASAYERDPSSAAAEYGAKFRSDIESFVTPEAVEAVTRSEPVEIPFHPSNQYVAFVDASGGSGQDSFTVAISHREEESAIVDLVREWKPPFSPASVVAECADILRDYRVSTATADRYAGAWVADEFTRQRIMLNQSAAAKSDIYRDFLPLINSQRVELPPVRKLTTQLVALERRTARGGRDSIDHPAGQHDDLINAAAGVATLTVARARKRAGVLWQ